LMQYQLLHLNSIVTIKTLGAVVDTASTSTLRLLTDSNAAVIDNSNDDVASWDILRIDVDAVSTTAPKGLIVTMEFRLP